MAIDDTLSEIGLDKYEAIVYSALLKRVIASPAEISKETKIPLTRAYSLLDALSEKGLANVVPGRPVRFQAAPLDVGLIPRINEKIKKLEELKTEIKKIEDEILERRVEKTVNLYQSWSIIRKIYAKSLKNVKKEAFYFLRFGRIDDEIYELMEKSIKKGVKIKILGPKMKETTNTAFRYKNIGCEVRFVEINKAPLVNFSVIDDESTYLNIYKEDEATLLVEINNSETAEFFKNIFMSLWKDASPLH